MNWPQMDDEQDTGMAAPVATQAVPNRATAWSRALAALAVVVAVPIVLFGLWTAVMWLLTDRAPDEAGGKLVREVTVREPGADVHTSSGRQIGLRYFTHPATVPASDILILPPTFGEVRVESSQPYRARTTAPNPSVVGAECSVLVQDHDRAGASSVLPADVAGRLGPDVAVIEVSAHCPSL